LLILAPGCGIGLVEVNRLMFVDLLNGFAELLLLGRVLLSRYCTRQPCEIDIDLFDWDL
jgi:hypothetical protein